MKFLLPNCRLRFTAADLEFLASVLARGPGQHAALLGLLADDEASRDAVLDEEALLHALLERPACTAVSAPCYFYILVRHLLRRAGLADRRLADYVAAVLAEAGGGAPAQVSVQGRRRALGYVFEMVAALREVDRATAFFLCAHIGDRALFITGVFPEHLRHRTERRAAPPLEWFEQTGRAHYRAASGHRLAEKHDVRDVLADLAEAFAEVRRALNDLSERLVSLGDAAPPGIRPPAC
jgi:hypothetical protein